ncbi:MAG: hypothetical protein ABR569_03475 [Gaiellaceae bacterium]
MAVGLGTARQEWEEASRRIESARGERPRYDRLLAQVEVVTEELRRRVGQTFTLAELALAYGEAERWARDAIGERAATPGWPLELATVSAAAFHRYQLGALDYTP